MTASQTLPHQYLGLAALMRRVFAGENLQPLSAQLIAHAEHNPTDANALMDLSTVLLLLGHKETGLAVQGEALRMQQVYTIPGKRGALRLLALKTPGDLMANTPVELLVENSYVALTTLYVGPGVPMVPNLPSYDVLMTAIGHSDANQPALAVQAKSLRHYRKHAKAINHPARIQKIEREAASRLLDNIPGLMMPPTVRVKRSDLAAIAVHRMWVGSLATSMAWPIIVRPVESHAGMGLAKIDTAAALFDYLETSVNPGEWFYVAPFVDYSSADGQYRKYRVILIDGKPFLCHMGISSDWMVHYLNAGMADSADKRAEEAQCMDAFDTVFAVKHQAALSAIAERTGLDYVGIDCGETIEGDLLVFEIDSDMIVHNLDAPDVYPYKAAHMEKLFAGFMDMLESRVR